MEDLYIDELPTLDGSKRIGNKILSLLVLTLCGEKRGVRAERRE